MTPERAMELARDMGLDSPPVPRVPVPESNKPIPDSFKPNFWKALQLVDQIETWAFERFIPDICVIDRSIDAHSYSPELSFAILMRTDVPPPSNPQIARVTGIKPEVLSAENQYRWLASAVADHYRELGAVSMGQPLIFRTDGRKSRKWYQKSIIPYVGAIMKFNRTPKDGRTREEMVADVGVMVPHGTPVKGREMPWPTDDDQNRGQERRGAPD